MLFPEYYSTDIDKAYLSAELLTAVTGINFDSTVDATMLSRFWTGEREISTDIKNKVTTDEYRKKCVNYFVTTIYPEISIDLLDDFRSKEKKFAPNS